MQQNDRVKQKFLPLPAPAKINLHLQVTATLDNGYHALDTSFAFVDVCDWLHIERSDTLEVTCSRDHLNGGDNLVYQLLLQFQKRHGVRQGLRIHIDKKLPEQAGLGGGSSDAATALLAANHLWELHLSCQQLIDFATPFGADIPCFLFARASLACGIGEQLRPYFHPLPTQSLLVAHPGVGLSTAKVFAKYDAALTPQMRADTMRAPSEAVIGCNDLQLAATTLLPSIANLLAAIDHDAQMAWMSGSGSSCVGLFSDQQQARLCAERLQSNALAEWVHVGHLLDRHPAKFVDEC
ncbi:MAG: 4-(cytidine 5'-diphospho)-2-C-methyl-D-erythritol kinase [Mariprofundales bacterium]